MRSRMMLLVMVVLIAAGAGALPDGRVLAQEHEHSTRVKGDYYCPMHPDYTSDRPGSCPICGMDLVKRKSVPAAPKTEAGVSVSTAQQQLIGLQKDIVQIRHLVASVSTVGKVAFDPELQVAQETYLQAVKAAASSEKSGLASLREQASDFLSAAERKLIFSGMSREDIAALKERGLPEEGLYLPSSSGKVWVYLTAYASELGRVKPGQEVAVTSETWPGETFHGMVAGVTPVLDAASRSARVRAEIVDPDGKLKPEMFVNARIDIDLGEKLAVPEAAVMDTGLRKIVYVVKGDTFSPREVELGPKAGGFYEVIVGVAEGEEVVTSGNFLIDSESRMKGIL